MNRLQYILSAKNQYNIQSPFVFDLYENVLSPKVGRTMLAQMGIPRADHFAQLRYKLADHYHATECTSTATLRGTDALLQCHDGSLIGLVRRPHASRNSEQQWEQLFKEPEVTLSVDLFDAGLLFTSKHLAKQHLLFREF